MADEKLTLLELTRRVLDLKTEKKKFLVKQNAAIKDVEEQIKEEAKDF